MASPPDRAQLERLDRDTLILRAEEAGVSRANILTRPELVDELLVRGALGAPKDDPRVSRARGFFGKARDLLARVIERGLHLPEAADRLRRVSIPPPPRTSAQTAVPTVTLAEIYATQGHTARAIETLNRVLEHEPDHAAASALLKQLSEKAVAAGQVNPGSEPNPEEVGDPGKGTTTTLLEPPAEPPRSEGTPAEPHGFLDDEPLPQRYDVDECVAIPVDPSTLFTYWEVRDQTLAYVRRSRPDGLIALRVLVITPSWEGPRSSTRDIDVGEPISDWFIRDLPPGAVVRVAMGWRQGDVFLPIAHSTAIETPPDAPSPMLTEAFLAWSPEGLKRIDASTPAEAVAVVLGRTPGRGARGGGATFRGKGGASAGGPGSAGFDDAGEPQGSSEHAYA